jgi:hypothetical protein
MRLRQLGKAVIDADRVLAVQATGGGIFVLFDTGDSTNIVDATPEDTIKKWHEDAKTETRIENHAQVSNALTQDFQNNGPMRDLMRRAGDYQ